METTVLFAAHKVTLTYLRVGAAGYRTGGNASPQKRIYQRYRLLWSGVFTVRRRVDSVLLE